MTAFQVLDLLEKMTSLRKVSLLLISHDWNVVRRVSDQILVMREGRVIAEGTAGQVSTASESYIRDKILLHLNHQNQMIELCSRLISVKHSR